MSFNIEVVGEPFEGDEVVTVTVTMPRSGHRTSIEVYCWTHKFGVENPPATISWSSAPLDCRADEAAAFAAALSTAVGIAAAVNRSRGH